MRLKVYRQWGNRMGSSKLKLELLRLHGCSELQTSADPSHRAQSSARHVCSSTAHAPRLCSLAQGLRGTVTALTVAFGYI